MKIPQLAKDKEYSNKYHIYLFYVEGAWMAFGHSAYYLSNLYPMLKATKKALSEDKEGMPYVHIPESFLAKLSAIYNTLASDNYVQIDAPPIAYCYRKDYEEWREKLNVM